MSVDARRVKQVQECSIKESLEAVRYHTEYLAWGGVNTQKDYHQRMIIEHTEHIESILENLLDRS